MYTTKQEGYMKQVTETELKQLQDMSTTLNEIIFKLGELHLTKKTLVEDMQQIDSLVSDEEKKFLEFREKERVLFQQFTQKYGTSNINVVTGEINP
jgi:hypothetical protein